MLIRKTLGAAIAAAAILTSGCASIVGDSKYPVEVSSAPTGASFEITDKEGKVVHSGNTPSTITLKSGRGYFKGETYTLRFKKDGYPDKVATLDSSLSGWYWGNILFGGLIGMLIVDPATGAMYKLPEGVSADMGAPVAQASGQKDLQIVMIDSLSPEARAKLVLVK
ncbi:hypothetical protein NVV94_10480 [Pseudomonas sp. LS1212]|uniref:hypothetical protein n=1 Tax=Pseudomonas sp. LS1212 TaxID=2972478 RepID=UPI00215B9199|nr:hypothetical protein [Pseudomonas sp. LS1212]UVJ45925.1 hypothetical protein NVV94_10480 [Pseudomonas sp. LS1212]